MHGIAPIQKQSMRGLRDWRACVWANIMCTQESERKVWHLTEIFLSRRKVQNLHHLGVNSSSRSTQGTEADREDMLWILPLLAPSLHPPTHSLKNIHKGGVMIISITRTKTCALRFCPVFHTHIDSPHSLSLIRLTDVPPHPFRWVVPTTRWRRVFCSGNSVCRTRCWLSEALWLFRRWLGASGPTAGVFYHPSGLGTGSGSWD